MYKRYYDGYPRQYSPRDNGEVIVPKSLPTCADAKDEAEKISLQNEIAVTSCGKKNSFLSSFNNIDDIILIGILLFLLLDKDKDCDDDGNDIFMLLLIGFIILSDVF